LNYYCFELVLAICGENYPNLGIIIESKWLNFG